MAKQSFARTGQALVLNAFSFWFLARVAHAYLEPGGTSFLLKLVISGLAGVVLVFSRFKGSIRLLFSRRPSGKAGKVVPQGQSQVATDEREATQEEGPAS
jgi:hypothetical protein